MDDFEEEDDWEEVIREPSPRNPFQKKSRVQIKRRQKGDEVYILCLSEGREEKDRAIRVKHEGRLIKDLERLKTRIEKGRLKKSGEDSPGDWSDSRSAIRVSRAITGSNTRRSQDSFLARGP